MRHKTCALALLGLSVVLAVAVLTVGVKKHGQAENVQQSASAGQPGAAQQTEPAEQQEQSGGLRSLFSSKTSEPSPTAEPTPTPEPTATPWPGPVVPEQAEPAPDGYFEDAAFVGNSLVTGLDFYDYNEALAGATFYAANSVTVLAVDEYLDQMEASGVQYDKVYVGLGTNEMSYDKDSLREYYNTMLDRLEEDNPGCTIYLMSVTPVSAYKSSTDRYFTRDLAVAYNEMLQDIATSRQVWYLDVFPVLADSEGYLPSDVTVDGVHFTPAHYENWFDYLQTHYIPDDGTTPVAAPAPDEGDEPVPEDEAAPEEEPVPA